MTLTAARSGYHPGMAFQLVMFILALVCFVGAAIPVPLARPVLGWLGMAFLTLALMKDVWVAVVAN